MRTFFRSKPCDIINLRKNMPMCQPINMYSPGYEQFTCDLQLLDVILRLTLYNNNYRLKKSGVFPL